MQPLRRVDVDAVLPLVHHGAELTQDVQVEVDRAIPDPAATEVGDERLAEPVQQRPAEQDRDAAGTGMRVDVGDVGALDVGRVQLDDAGGLVRGHPHAVQLQKPSDHRDVADPRDVVQLARSVAQERRDHRLGDEVLGAAEGGLTAEGGTTVDLHHVAHGAHRRSPTGCASHAARDEPPDRDRRRSSAAYFFLPSLAFFAPEAFLDPAALSAFDLVALDFVAFAPFAGLVGFAALAGFAGLADAGASDSTAGASALTRRCRTTGPVPGHRSRGPAAARER